MEIDSPPKATGAAIVDHQDGTQNDANNQPILSTATAPDNSVSSKTTNAKSRIAHHGSSAGQQPPRSGESSQTTLGNCTGSDVSTRPHAPAGGIGYTASPPASREWAREGRVPGGLTRATSTAPLRSRRMIAVWGPRTSAFV